MANLKISDMVKTTSVILGLILTVWAIDSKFDQKAKAAEEKAVITMQTQTKALEEKIEAAKAEKDFYRYKLKQSRLKDLRALKALLEERIQEKSKDNQLKEKLEIVNNEIEKIEFGDNK